MASKEKPAYLIACMTRIEGKEPDPNYLKLATRPAIKAGNKLIGGGYIGEGAQVLEGALPEGAELILLERFRSMDSLQEFWYSQEYQKAIQLRMKSSKMHFVIAVENADKQAGNKSS